MCECIECGAPRLLRGKLHEKCSLVWLTLLLCFSVVVFSQPAQRIVNYVTDETGTLSSSQLASLESKLSQFEKETSNQVVVYIMKTLEGESLEEKSYEIAEKNGIGQ